MVHITSPGSGRHVPVGRSRGEKHASDRPRLRHLHDRIWLFQVVCSAALVFESSFIRSEACVWFALRITRVHNARFAATLETLPRSVSQAS